MSFVLATSVIHGEHPVADKQSASTFASAVEVREYCNTWFVCLMVIKLII